MLDLAVILPTTAFGVHVFRPSLKHTWSKGSGSSNPNQKSLSDPPIRTIGPCGPLFHSSPIVGLHPHRRPRSNSVNGSFGRPNSSPPAPHRLWCGPCYSSIHAALAQGPSLPPLEHDWSPRGVELLLLKPCAKNISRKGPREPCRSLPAFALGMTKGRGRGHR